MVEKPGTGCSLGRIHDVENNGVGITCEWLKLGRSGRWGEYLPALARPAKESPKICSLIMEAMERGIFDALGVKMRKLILRQG